MEKTLIRAVSDQPGRIDPCSADLDRRRINHPLLAFLVALFERPAADLDPLTEALPQAPFDLGRLGQLANLLDRTFHRVPAEDLRLYPEQASEKELKPESAGQAGTVADPCHPARRALPQSAADHRVLQTRVLRRTAESDARKAGSCVRRLPGVSLCLRSLGIDLVGYPGEYAGAFELERYRLFNRAGLRMLPLTYSAWCADREAELAAVDEALAEVGSSGRPGKPEKP